MKNRKNIKVGLDTIINLIDTAEDYGFTEIYSDLFQMLDYKLTDSEIQSYSKDNESEDCIERLQELRDLYCEE